jgi:tellurite resistance protein TehA-like permease
MTLITWAWATWWIPLLATFGIWKHVVRRAPLTYSTALWSLVFPLGMYSLATLRLALVADLPPLYTLAPIILAIAIAAWATTAAGLARAAWQSFHRFERSNPRLSGGARSGEN